MLWMITIVLLLLWAAGLVSATTMGGYIHILVVVAIIVVALRVLTGRRA